MRATASSVASSAAPGKLPTPSDESLQVLIEKLAVVAGRARGAERRRVGLGAGAGGVAGDHASRGWRAAARASAFTSARIAAGPGGSAKDSNIHGAA